VQEALSGLPGVESVQADLEHNRLRVRYDPARQTLQALLKVVEEQGFDGKVVPEGGRAGPP
jgi:copper chaperone CopZ